MQELARQLVDTLASLEVGEASDAAAGRALARLDPVEAAGALADLVRSSRGSPRAAHALVVVMRALELAGEADLPLTHRRAIHDAALEFGLTTVVALFVHGAPARELDPSLADAPDPVVGHLTLGHKRMLARKVDGDRLARLALEPDPRVMREVLLNPRVTEDLVVRIAARRPARAQVLEEIWRSRKWSLRARVRTALALNPYTAPEIGLKLLPGLALADLKAAAADGALHANVRDLARVLLEQRLPARGALQQPAEGVADAGEAAGEDHEDQGGHDEGDLAGGEVEGRHRGSD